MSDGKFPPENLDDLPRTFRRAREQQLRDQMAQTQLQQPQQAGRGTPVAPVSYAPEPINPYDTPYGQTADGPSLAEVTRFRVPFFSLMGFFIKAVFAAIPALLILIAMFYGLGRLLQTYFPELIKMKIVITFPG